MLAIQTNVASTQAKGTVLCVHVGSVAFHLGSSVREDVGLRVELFTPYHRFRIAGRFKDWLGSWFRPTCGGCVHYKAKGDGHE